MPDYSEDDLLLLSGIQHFAFCERQWGLIHVENQWAENVRTVEGKQLHERVDDPFFTETRGDVRIERSVPLVSRTLGLYGVADVIELQRVPGYSTGVKYNVVEYKRGKPKSDDTDQVQLCAQAICLEEMRGISLSVGYLYYGEIKRRNTVDFSDRLRTRVCELADRMHVLFTSGVTPSPIRDGRCKKCSLKDLCVPEVFRGSQMLKAYFRGIFDEMRNELSGEDEHA